MLTISTTAGLVLCERCTVADTPLSRLRGLLGRSDLARDEGLLISPASSIHMAFMRFPIDALFVAADGEVLRVVEHLRPWQVASRRGARYVVELAAGECAQRGVAAGDRLVISPPTMVV